ncbi:uncharacterized protein RHOBADRAFT_55343 [Rhodotorula graminis WP1]|uniref:Myb-like domain-containing protein n=1 Tax=Rhodotorula graminis (strain WP1) TaxID=578459 RepID=A0A0P9EMR7_RHOGW|nr:uncharacterized protein RHOBADRAFT_55343 [Rhodotorula graminis WP1]KPV73122.1 hypothetical protein RHOBADRAFT_55343 [Rhodotorula graminis WP1]
MPVARHDPAATASAAAVRPSSGRGGAVVGASGTASTTWSSADDDSLLLLRLDGHTKPVCADRLSKTLDSVTERLTHLYATGRLAAALKPWTAENDQQLARLHQAKPVGDIAQVVGRPTIAVVWRIDVLRKPGGLLGASSARARAASRPSELVASEGPAASTREAASGIGGDVEGEGRGASRAAGEQRQQGERGGGGATSISPSETKKGPYSAEEDAVIIQLRAGGRTFADIGQQISRSARSVTQRFTILKGKGRTSAPPGYSEAAPTPTAKIPSLPIPFLARDDASTTSASTSTASPAAPSTPAPAANHSPFPTDPTDSPSELLDDAVIVGLLKRGRDYATIGAALGTSSRSVAERVDAKRSDWLKHGLLLPSSLLAQPVGSPDISLGKRSRLDDASNRQTAAAHTPAPVAASGGAADGAVAGPVPRKRLRKRWFTASAEYAKAIAAAGRLAKAFEEDLALARAQEEGADEGEGKGKEV